jgi:hypothetical protein
LSNEHWFSPAGTLLTILSEAEAAKWREQPAEEIAAAKSPKRLFALRAEFITPPVPLKWISRSLSVTGGRPSREHLTSNEGLSSSARDPASYCN